MYIKLLNFIFLETTITWLLPKQNNYKFSRERNVIKDPNFHHAISWSEQLHIPFLLCYMSATWMLVLKETDYQSQQKYKTSKWKINFSTDQDVIINIVVSTKGRSSYNRSCQPHTNHLIIFIYNLHIKKQYLMSMAQI